jgi:3-oxoacyl-[acyl-carrier-protein] synthase-1
MKPLSLLASGLVTPVGFTASSSCAALRCVLDAFSETRFMDLGGEWIMGGQVFLEESWTGMAKLVRMVLPAIRECLEEAGSPEPGQIPLLLGVAEKERPGRLPALDERILRQIEEAMQLRFHPHSAVFPFGRVAGAMALSRARELIRAGEVTQCLVAGTDSFLSAATLAHYEREERLLTSQNSNGFIPGEAAGAVLVGDAAAAPAPTGKGVLQLYGIGTGTESATILSGEPLRGDGLVAAIKEAFADGGIDFDDLDYRITDANGEQYAFKEAALGLNRILRKRKEEFDIWHPVDCIGESGAASGPCVFALALAAARKGFAPGHGVLCHFGTDEGQRSALTFRTLEGDPS